MSEEERAELNEAEYRLEAAETLLLELRDSWWVPSKLKRKIDEYFTPSKKD